MGCCTSAQGKKKSANSTFRDQQLAQQQQEYYGDNGIFYGKRAKDVVDNTDFEDLILAVMNSQFQLVEAICIKHNYTNVCEIRGYKKEVELLQRQKYDLSNWNVMLIAIAYNNMDAFRFFTKELYNHLRLGLRAPLVQKFCKVQDSMPQWAESFPILVALNNRNLEFIKFIWEELMFLWDSFHLEFIIEEMADMKYLEGLKFILRSQNSQEIYHSMTAQDKRSFISNILIKRQSKRQLDVKEILKDELSKAPYASISIFVMMHDSKGFSANAPYLEKAYNNLEAAEFGRFKFTINNFQDYVERKIQEYMNCEDSQTQKDLGNKLKTKLEKLEHEVFKLKGGFVSALEYDNILTNKLFEYAENGNKQDFQTAVKESDVREEEGTIYLILIIQQGNENYMTGIKEELQAYSLIVACFNKDDKMLRYLWEHHGSYLWTDRHFEVVMRYIIEIQWIEGISILLSSENTHLIIKALSSDERAFFIDNMIGDITIMQNEDMKTILYQELSKQPYAGILLLTLIDRFDQLTEQEQQFWQESCQNLYKLELEVLTKSSASRFGKFIKDYIFNRQNDELKQRACLIIDKLKEVKMFYEMIEDQNESAFKLGEEEVRFLKKDAVECPLPYVIDIIKFAITGNVKQIQKIVKQEKLTCQDIQEIRGLQVKIYDESKEMINTRMWNPLHYAIFYRQHQTIEYFLKDLQVNLKIASNQPYTSNERAIDSKVQDLIGSHDDIYCFLISIYARDEVTLKYLYEDKISLLQTDENDVVKLLQLCVTQNWAQGFLLLMESDITERIFINSSLEYKEQFVQYILSNEVLQSKCICQHSDESVVRNIKDKMISYPYCSMSWKFIDPLKDIKNQRLIKELTQNFDEAAMEVFAVSKQFDTFVQQESQIYQVQLDEVDEEELSEQEKKEREEKLKYYQELQSRWQTYKDGFIEKMKQNQPNLLQKQTIENTCTEIVEKILQSKEKEDSDIVEAFLKILRDNNVVFIQFVDGYKNESLWQRYHKFKQSVQMEKLNIFNWILFYNKPRILTHILKNFSEDQLHVARTLAGDHPTFQYEYLSAFNEKRSIILNKIGAIVCIFAQSIDCFQVLLQQNLGIFSAKEILDLSIIICNENWKAGLSLFLPLIEAAFAKMAVIKRIEYIDKLVEVKGMLSNDILGICKVYTFIEWMKSNYKSQNVERSAQVKQMSLSPQKSKTKQRETQMVQFLSRYFFNQQDNQSDDNQIQTHQINLQEKEDTKSSIKPNDRTNLK